MTRPIVLLLLAATLSGCAAARVAPPPAPISHFVLVKLSDPAEADAFIAASDAALATIPHVKFYASGRHLDTGRAAVDGTYDVAFYFGFDSVEDYEAYLAHPAHEVLVRDWRDRLEWMRIYDMRDESP